MSTPATHRGIGLLAFLLFATDGWGASDSWPQWRGPQRDGSVEGTAWPQNLQCLEQLWEVELGPGYPGPIVSADRVFVAETRDKEIEVVRAIDRATGDEIWRTEWPGAWKVPFFAAKNGSWIRSTPAWDGSSLFVGGIREVLSRLDGSTGEIVWSVDFPARFGTKVPDFGFASSPLVDGESIYIQAANSLVKLDKNNGRVIWRTLQGDGGMGSSGAFSSPILATLADHRHLVVQTRLELFGIEPSTGDILWSHPIPNFRGMNILTPVVNGDTVFTSSYRNGSYLLRVSQRDGRFEVKQEWQHKAHGYMSTPVVIDDHAYLHLGNQRLTCIDLATGEDRWTTTPFGKYWSKVFQGDQILALDERGDLHLFEASPEAFQLLDSKSVSDSETWAHLAVAGDQLFVRSLDRIAAYRWCRSDEATVGP